MKRQCKYGKRATSCRASRLDGADNGSRFNADNRGIDNANSGLLEIVKYAGTFSMLRGFLECEETCGRSFAAMKTYLWLSEKQEGTKH